MCFCLVEPWGFYVSAGQRTRFSFLSLQKVLGVVEFGNRTRISEVITWKSRGCIQSVSGYIHDTLYQLCLEMRSHVPFSPNSVPWSSPAQRTAPAIDFWRQSSFPPSNCSDDQLSRNQKYRMLEPREHLWYALGDRASSGGTFRSIIDRMTVAKRVLVRWTLRMNPERMLSRSIWQIEWNFQRSQSF
jgi:hypothetical protein